MEEKYSKAPLRETSQAALIDSIRQQAERVQSMQATVDIDTSAGGVKKGQVTDYKEIRGDVLARKPAMLHMIGLLPIVRTTAFDMVSNGDEFKLWIPPRNRFVVGRNEVQSHNPAQPMESIRPQDIYDALLIRPIDPEREIAVLENSYEILHDSKGNRVLQEDYELIVIRKKGEEPATEAEAPVLVEVKAETPAAKQDAKPAEAKAETASEGTLHRPVLKPGEKELVPGGITEQTEQVIANLQPHIIYPEAKKK